MLSNPSLGTEAGFLRMATRVSRPPKGPVTKEACLAQSEPPDHPDPEDPASPHSAGRPSFHVTALL